MPESCSACGQAGAALWCAKCRQTAYCDRECQRHHWRVGGHKHECTVAVAAAAASDAADCKGGSRAGSGGSGGGGGAGDDGGGGGDDDGSGGGGGGGGGAPLEVGQPVVMRGLVSAHRYNGMAATVVRHIPEQSRYVLLHQTAAVVDGEGEVVSETPRSTCAALLTRHTATRRGVLTQRRESCSPLAAGTAVTGANDQAATFVRHCHGVG